MEPKVVLGLTSLEGSPRSMSTSLPLRFRIPNEPADFVGRGAEVSELARNIDEAVVTAVYGPGGLGKTSLVLHVLHRNTTWPPERRLFVSVRPGESGDEIKQDIIRAVAAASNQEVDWAAIQSDSQALTESLIDLVEADGWCVVLDDLHHAVGTEVDSLLDELARYCRKSRFVAAMRPAPSIERGSFRLLSLKGMSGEDLALLASTWGTRISEDTIQQAANRSGGSPWIFRHALNTGRASTEVGEAALLEELAMPARNLLFLAVAIDEALPREIWSRLGGGDVPEALAETERRGYWERSGGGLRLHEMVKDALRGGPPAVAGFDARLHDAARVLCRQDDLLAILEGVRLLLLLGDVGLVRRTLDPLVGRIVESGYAPRLWRLISSVDANELESIRLRCAAELGNPTVLDMVHRPTVAAAPEDSLTWAETLYMRGELDHALRAFESVETSAKQAPAVAFTARVGRIRTLLAQGAGAAAAALASEPKAQDKVETLVLSALAAASELQMGSPSVQGAGVVGATTELAPRLVALPEDLRDDVVFELAVAAVDAGAVALAENVLSFSHRGRGGALDLFVTRRMLCARVLIDLQSGRLDAASDSLVKLRPFLRSRSLLLPDILCADASLQLTRGDTEECRRLLDRARTESQSLRAGRAGARAARLATRLNILRPSVDAGAETDDGLGRMIGLIQTGDLERAHRDLRTALQAAVAGGNAVEQAELLTVLCDVCLLEKDRAALTEHAAQLSRLGETNHSERFITEGKFFAIASAPEPDAAALETLAAHPGAGRATRRAQMLLGESPAHGAVDERVVRAIQDASGFRPITLEGSLTNTRGAGWGIDLNQTRVWTANGKWIDFGRRPQHLEVLQVLCQLGGGASKEQLLTQAWHESEYHPLRHDTRLQVAVRKLRELIEDDPSRPVRLQTTAEGYKLMGPVRVLGMLPPGQERLS